MRTDPIMSSAGRSKAQIPLVLYVFLNFLRFLTLSTLVFAIVGEFISLVSNLESHQKKKVMAGIEDMWEGRPGITMAAGGVFGFALSRILKLLTLFAGFVSILPLPAELDKRVQSVWQRGFPPFAAERGDWVLGALMVYFGSSALAERIVGAPRIAAWFLLIVGLLNFLSGVIFGSSSTHLHIRAGANEHIPRSRSVSPSSLPITRVSAPEETRPESTERRSVEGYSDEEPEQPHRSSQPTEAEDTISIIIHPTPPTTTRRTIPLTKSQLILSRLRPHPPLPHSPPLREQQEMENRFSGTSVSIYSQRTGLTRVPSAPSQKGWTTSRNGQRGEEKDGVPSGGVPIPLPPPLSRPPLRMVKTEVSREAGGGVMRQISHGREWSREEMKKLGPMPLYRRNETQ